MICPTVAGTTTFWPGWIMVMLAPGLGPGFTPEVRGRILGPVPGLAEVSRAGLMLVLTVGILEQFDWKLRHIDNVCHLICATAELDDALVARSTGTIWAGGELVVGGVSFELILTRIYFQFMEFSLSILIRSHNSATFVFWRLGCCCCTVSVYCGQSRLPANQRSLTLLLSV